MKGPPQLKNINREDSSEQIKDFNSPPKNPGVPKPTGPPARGPPGKP